MRFICLGYIKSGKFEGMAQHEQQAMMDECFAYDDELRAHGHFAAGEALQGPQTAATLKSVNGKVVVTDGPFAETKEQIGGILMLEADDLDHAVRLMSKHPGVRCGPFEIRPASADMNAQCPSPTTAANIKKEYKKFLCLGYVNEVAWDAMTEAERSARMQSCLAYDEILKKNVQWLGGEGLQGSRTAKTLQWRDGRVLVTDGPFAETKEQLGGVVMIAVKDMSQAIELMSKHPGVEKVSIEIRPADESINALIAARDQAAKAKASAPPAFSPR